jgi:hypothetical protein
VHKSHRNNRGCVDYITDEYQSLRKSGVSHFIASRRMIDLWRTKKREVNNLFGTSMDDYSDDSEDVIQVTESRIYVNELIREVVRLMNKARYFRLNDTITITSSDKNRCRLRQLMALLLYREDLLPILDEDLIIFFSSKIEELLEEVEHKKSVLIEYQQSYDEVDHFRALLIRNSIPKIRRMIDVSDVMGMKKGTRGLGLEFNIFLNILRGIFKNAISNINN